MRRRCEGNGRCIFLRIGTGGYIVRRRAIDERIALLLHELGNVLRGSREVVCDMVRIGERRAFLFLLLVRDTHGHDRARRDLGSGGRIGRVHGACRTVCIHIDDLCHKAALGERAHGRVFCHAYDIRHLIALGNRERHSIA